MSGTSLDGIDLAEIKLILSNDKNWRFEILNASTKPYSSLWKKKLRESALLLKEQVDVLDMEYTQYLSEVINGFISAHKITNLDAVCSHGHTVMHQPDEGITLQIGNLPKLASLISENVVCDFRTQDVLLGGQGAPLVPIGDALLFNQYDYCLNLGGFANISFNKNGSRVAFDICPVNIVLNVYAENLGLSFDDKGSIAASGVLDRTLLGKLNRLPFYVEVAPKSLGIEWVREFVLPMLEKSSASVEDKMRTIVEHIAIQISNQIEIGTNVLVTGGGVYNVFLMSRIQAHCKLKFVLPSNELIEFKEALIFGLLGALKLRGAINCLASVTGAENNHSSGKIYFG